MGCDPDHVPSLAVRVWPSATVPEIVGGLVFDGGTSGAPITEVAADVAGVEPLLFEPVTRRRIVEPTSTDVSV
jgi:hypothetical protein